MGFELEVGHDNGYNSCTCEYCESGEGCGYEDEGGFYTEGTWAVEESKLFHIKDDCSIRPSGFEMASLPLTFEFIKENREMFAKILDSLQDEGYGSGADFNCGMHVHITKKAVKNFHLYKLLSFIYNNQEFTADVSGRDPYCLSEWASLYDSYTRVERAKDKRKGDRGAISLGRSETIEFRIFSGTLDPSELMKNLEFVHAIFFFTRDNPPSAMKPDFFKGWVSMRVKDYPNLHRWLDENSTERWLECA
jgi:hypothetical protein